MKQQGMILLTTLLMLTMLTLLVLSLMQLLLLHTKASHEVWRHHESLYALEHAARGVNFANRACQVHDKGPNQVIHLLEVNQGCLGEGYQYLVEDLHTFPCLPIVNKSSHHWLVTLMTTRAPHTLLQIRIARPGMFEACTSGPARPIHAGMLSWRKLTI
jgi:hypothetical protein